MHTIVIARIALAVAVVGFLMPWLSVALWGTGPSISGFSLATGLLQSQFGGGVYWPFTAAGLAVVVGLLGSLGSDEKASSSGVAAAAILGIVSMLGGLWWMRSEVDSKGFGVLLQEGIGFWLTLGSLAVATVTGLVTASEREVSKNSSPQVALSPLPARSDDDIAAWDRISDKENADALQEYLLRHPQGRFSELARLKLERMGVAPLGVSARNVAEERKVGAPSPSAGSVDHSFASNASEPKPDDLFVGVSTSEIPSEPKRGAAAPLVIGGILVLALGAGGAFWMLKGASGSDVGKEGETVEAVEPIPPPPPTWDQLLQHRIIDFEVPSRMEVGVPVEIEFKISSPDANAPQVEETISAILTGDSFDVENRTVERQKFSSRANMWRWTVTPIELGQRTLRLELFAASAADGSAHPIDLHEKTILVGQVGVVPEGQRGAYWPSVAVTVTATEARFREAPMTTSGTRVIGAAEPGQELDVIGLAKESDWYWYEVKFDDGSTGFIRSDLTSQPMRGSQAPPQAILPNFAFDAPASENAIERVEVIQVPRYQTSSTIAQAIHGQLISKGCWGEQRDMPETARLRAVVAVKFGQDGRFISEPQLVDPGREPSNDPAMQVFIQRARSALAKCNQIGFDVPREYFTTTPTPMIEIVFQR